MPAYIICVTCGDEFAVPPSRAKTAKTCSNECARNVRGLSRRRRINKACDNCGAEFEVPVSHIDRRKFCSNDCRYSSAEYRKLRSDLVTLESNPMWKGGRSQTDGGYFYALAGVDHPYSTKAGYVLEHRLVMERWLRANTPDSHLLISLGRTKYLSPEYQVHHRDEDRSNNNIENLVCLTPSDHMKLHADMRRNKKQAE